MFRSNQKQGKTNKEHMEKEKEEMKYPSRGPVSDKILLLMSDGKVRKTREIAEEINWPTTTNIANTMSDLKISLIENRDSRRLKKIPPDNSNKGIQWQLITKK
jgi:hypothetical protein